jgi:hypothetical protein
VPVGIETSTYGAYGPQGIKLVKQMGKKIQEATGEKLSTFSLFQSISMALIYFEIDLQA